MTGTAAGSRWGLVGHDQAIRNLAESVATGNVSHAYLLTGPEGVGRTTLALAFARALNCERPPEERPCGRCDSCRRITVDSDHRSHPDVTVADLDWQADVIGGPADDRSRQRQRMSIETIRWLRQDIVSRPIQGRWKVQIIDDADRFSEAAPDAFLKTLEEPPAYAVIILIASSIDNVPETVRSRCRHIGLGAVPQSEIERELVERGLDGDEAARLARAARGRIAWALELANDPERRSRRRELVNQAFEHVTDPLGRLNISGPVASNHSAQRDRTFDLLDVYAGLWRDAIVLRAGLPELVAYPEVADRLSAYAQRVELGDLYRALWATQRCMTDLDANFQARIALHAMVMQWPE